MEKRVSCRGIVFINNNIAVMHRVRKDSDYYVLPGGGVEETDIDNEYTVIREVKEEFGIDVKPCKCVYKYENDKSIQYFYLCEMIGGTFGTGNGPEMESYDEDKGFYLPNLINVDKIDSINLKPDMVTKVLIDDIIKNGLSLSDSVINIEDDCIKKI